MHFKFLIYFPFKKHRYMRPPLALSSHLVHVNSNVLVHSLCGRWILLPREPTMGTENASRYFTD